MARSLFRTVFLNQHCTYRKAIFLTRLVEAEIVSPYHGILINTGMGNPTMPSIVVLGKQAIRNGQPMCDIRD